MPFIASVAGQFEFGRARRPAAPAPSGIGGALSFPGTASSYLSVANDADFRFGTGDFTVEWFQYLQSGGGSAGRIFAIGTYSTQSIAVSLEGSDTSKTFYLWVSNANAIESGQNYQNQWIHFAVCRSGTSLRIFKNGTQIGTTLTNSTNFNDTTNAFRIGNESSPSAIASFKGYITNFRWIKGTALYTSNFTRPAAPLTATANTKLLLLASTSGTATTDSSSAAKTVTNSNATWVSNNPF